MLNPSQLELHKNLNLGRMSQKISRVFKQSGVIPYRVRNGKSILADHKSQMSTLADSQRRHQKSDGLGRFCSKEA